MSQQTYIAHCIVKKESLQGENTNTLSLSVCIETLKKLFESINFGHWIKKKEVQS